MLTGKGAGNHAWRCPELWLRPYAPTRLPWPPGGVRQLAAGPQLLTVSGTPFHVLWLCLIEDQGYRRRRPRSRARRCVVWGVAGCGTCVQKMLGKGARTEPALGRRPACGQSGPRGVWPESSKTRMSHSVGCRHVACSCACHKAQAQVGRHEPDVMASRYQHLVGLQNRAGQPPWATAHTSLDIFNSPHCCVGPRPPTGMPPLANPREPPCVGVCALRCRCPSQGRTQRGHLPGSPCRAAGSCC